MAHAGCVGHFIVVVVDCVCMTLKSKSLLVIMMISKKKNEKYSRQLDVYFSFIRCVCESYGIRQKTLNH